jgi:Trk K+ transport system NAD-binding subunit
VQNAHRERLNRLGESVSRLLRPPRTYAIVVGVSPRIRLLVTELGAVGKQVSLIRMEGDAVTIAKAPTGVIVHAAHPDAVVLERAGAKAASFLIAATANDDLNLGLCRDARDKFGVPTTIARLNLLDGVTSWAQIHEAGMTRITWAETVHATLGETRPSARLSCLAKISDQQQITDIEMRSPVFVGQRITLLPFDGTEVLGMLRNGMPVRDLNSIELHMNDILTLAGAKATLARIRETLTSL